MLRFIYDLFIRFYGTGIRIAALAGNRKAVQWIEGRKNITGRLREALKDAGKTYWFHCASLGEFEQGRPLIEAVRSREPEAFILLTFFSPSGYEYRKNYEKVNAVFYLPLDTRKNATDFVNIVRPSKAFFIKYEYWYHYLNELSRKDCETYMVSSIFRKDQRFFRPYGRFFRRMLRCITHFFIQDESSAKLLKSSGFTNYTITGDTRFDRVAAIATAAARIPEAESFIQDTSFVIVAGSTWDADERLLAGLLEKTGGKLIIAPHETGRERITESENTFSNRFGSKSIARLSTYRRSGEHKVLIIDSVGLLSSLYRYATICWIGGGFGRGIHNITEAAVYGKPVLFGPKYGKFREAITLIERKGAFACNNEGEAERTALQLRDNPGFLRDASSAASEFILSGTGATEKIMKSVFKS